MDWELRYCQNNANTIYRLAKHVYNSVAVKKELLMVKNCCDFEKLEAACSEYAAAHPLNEKRTLNENQESVQ